MILCNQKPVRRKCQNQPKTKQASIIFGLLHTFYLTAKYTKIFVVYMYVEENYQ